MSLLRSLWRRIRSVYRREEVERDMAEEMRYHLEERTAENIEDGLPTAEARLAAQRRFGNFGLIQDLARDQRVWRWPEQIAQDFRFAARQVRKSPAFAAVAILTLALGIGMSTALFSAFNTLVLHPLLVPKPQQLVRLWTSNPALGYDAPMLSWPRYEFIRDRQDSYTSVSASTYTGYTVTRPEAEPENVNTLAITANFFPTLGVAPARGRNFSAAEDTVGGPKVVMLGYNYWQRALGGRESAVGETLRLNDEPYTIVGIAPRALSNPYGTVELFVPRPFDQRASADVQRGMSFLEVTARLKPGVTPAQAGSEAAILTRNYRGANPGLSDTPFDLHVKTFADELVGDLRPTFYVLLAAVGFVLLIACANVAALFLGRLNVRHREIAVRLSVGASRGQLVRQFLVESALSAALAGGLGALLAQGALTAMQRLLVDTIPPGVALELDGTVLAFTVGVSALAAVLVGLVPAWQASRADLVESLKDAARGSSGGPRTGRLRSALIVGEVALSVVLLVLSGLLLSSFVRLQRSPAGFNPAGIATALVSLPTTRYPAGPAQVRFYEELVDRLEARPPVRSAALAIGAPLTGFQRRRSYAIAGRPIPPVPERPLANFNVVTEHYFTTMQIALRRGRGFDARDDERAPKKCLINESFAKRLFPGESALGKVILSSPRFDEPSEIIGITADVKSAGLTAAPPDEIYFSLRQSPWQLAVVLVRTEGNPRALESLIRSTVAEIDRRQPIASFATLDFLVAQSLGTQRIAAWLAGAFAAVALLLSSIGLYSVLAYTVAQRTGEIGIRMALGAQRGQVVALVLGAGLRLVALGLGAGLAVAAGAARLSESLLFGVQPLDPLIYGGVSVLFTAIAFAACAVPSWRASRIDPLVALRAE